MLGAMGLVLYDYWRSSSAHRVRFALEYKGIAYESRAVDLRAGEQRAAGHLERSPLGVVPTLVVDGRPLTESVAILEYLEETFPEPRLLPQDPWARARVRQLVQFVNSAVQPLQNLLVLQRVSSDSAVQKEWVRFFVDRGLSAYERTLGEVERELGPGRFSVGDALTLADVYLVPQLVSARRFDVPLEAFPRIVRVFEACMQLEAAVLSMPDRQPDATR
jgi:maleylacetoacetate isomerase